jgi:hypothetical protein
MIYVSLAMVLAASLEAATPGGDPWPRTAQVNNAKISIYQPQLESWTGNLLDAYAAVTIKTQSSHVTNYGSILFMARTEVDKVNRIVTLSDVTLTKRNFRWGGFGGFRGRR